MNALAAAIFPRSRGDHPPSLARLRAFIVSF